MLLDEALPDPPGRVPLLTRRLAIRLQPLVDHRPKRPQLRSRPRHRRALGRRHSGLQRLAHRPPMHTVTPRQLPDRQPLPRLIAPDRLELLHSRHSFRPFASRSTKREPNGSDRTEVGPVQASTVGPDEASTPTTRRRPPLPSSAGSGHGDTGRRDPRAHRLRPRSSPGQRSASRYRGRGGRWVIRWAEPCRIGPYQARPRAFCGATVWADLQAFRRLDAPRTPCFTRERSQVRNPPRPCGIRLYRPVCGSAVGPPAPRDLNGLAPTARRRAVQQPVAKVGRIQAPARPGRKIDRAVPWTLHAREPLPGQLQDPSGAAVRAARLAGTRGRRGFGGRRSRRRGDPAC